MSIKNIINKKEQRKDELNLKNDYEFTNTIVRFNIFI